MPLKKRELRGPPGTKYGISSVASKFFFRHLKKITEFANFKNGLAGLSGLLSEVRSRGSESPSEVTRSEHGWRIEEEPTIRTYDKVTPGPLQAHYPMGTGHGPKGSRSLESAPTV